MRQTAKRTSKTYIHAHMQIPTSPRGGGSGKKSVKVWYIFPNQSKITPTPRFFPFFGFFPPNFWTPTPIFSAFCFFSKIFFYTHPCPTPSPSFPVTTLIYILWRLRTRCFYKKLERASSSRSFLFFAHL